jgi:hypothetical protein
MACSTASPRVAYVTTLSIRSAFALALRRADPYPFFLLSRLLGHVLSLRRLRPEQAAIAPFAAPGRSSAGRRHKGQYRLSCVLLRSFALLFLGFAGTFVFLRDDAG